jgi:hypothetical protein
VWKTRAQAALAQAAVRIACFIHMCVIFYRHRGAMWKTSRLLVSRHVFFGTFQQLGKLIFLQPFEIA